MNFEESMERLKERHEALSQSVEMLLASQRQTERLMAEQAARTDRQIAETGHQIRELLQFINQLAHVAESHERRLDDLDKR